MKKLLIAALAAGALALAPSAVWAQDQHPSVGGERPAPHPQPMSGPSHMESGHPTMGGPRPMMSRPPRPSTSHHTTYRLTTSHHTTYRRTVVHHAAVHVTTRHFTRPRTTAHIDIREYRKNITAERRFHYGEYRQPAGYAYRRWTFGERLPSIYFARQYWIPNYWNFGLAWAPEDCQWVRFGPDALLIDIDTGEIIQVVYGVFY
jgi:Ni/Co efflux regulator RcnB